MKRLGQILIGGLLLICLGMALFVFSPYWQPPPDQALLTPVPLPEGTQVDAIHVDKSERLLRLLLAGQVVREYRVALGASPVGHKTEEGDEKTPVGEYVIDWRNPNSIAHLSLHISYPNAADIAQAEARGVSPGGAIMIHGIMNGWGYIGARHLEYDWTDGCIAVTNEEMQEIWDLVPDGTPITISE